MFKRYFYRRFLINALLVVALALITTVGIFTQQNIQQLEGSVNLVIHTQQVISESERLLSYVKDAELAFQGYLVSQDSLYLAPYFAVDAQISVAMRHLFELTDDNPAQHERLSRISQLIARKLSVLHEEKNYVDLNRTYDVRQVADLQYTGLLLMDTLRRQVSGLVDVEQGLMAERVALLDQAERSTLRFQYVVLILSLLFLFLAFVGLNVQMYRRDQANHQLADANNNLENNVRDRTEALFAANQALRGKNEQLNALLEKQHQTHEKLEQQQQRLATAYQAIEDANARKTRELSEARALQMAMLPGKPPPFTAATLGVHMQTATEVGGDYYDFYLDQTGEVLTLAVGDATGHGLKAGIIVATAKSYFQSLAERSEPAEILDRISQGIRNLALRVMFMGLTVVRFRDGRLTMASAGMPPAYLYRRADGTVETILLKGLFLGSHLTQTFPHFETPVLPGDTLLMQTDGLAELHDAHGEMLGYGRIRDRFAARATLPPDDIVADLLALGRTWAPNKTAHDDITLTVVRFH